MANPSTSYAGLSSLYGRLFYPGSVVNQGKIPDNSPHPVPTTLPAFPTKDECRVIKLLQKRRSCLSHGEIFWGLQGGTVGSKSRRCSCQPSSHQKPEMKQKKTWHDPSALEPRCWNPKQALSRSPGFSAAIR